jgi:hypothetical protein
LCSLSCKRESASSLQKSSTNTMGTFLDLWEPFWVNLAVPKVQGKKQKQHKKRICLMIWIGAYFKLRHWAITSCPLVNL